MKMQFDDQDIALLVYRAYFLEGDDRNRSIKKIAEFLIANKVDFCSWINSLKENHFAGIIYPEDMLFLGDFIREEYIIKYNELNNFFRGFITDAEKCNILAATPEGIF